MNSVVDFPHSSAYSITNSDVDSPQPTPPKQSFFLVNMLDLGDRPRHPGHILAIHTLINITKVATKDLQTACVTNATGSDAVGASIARLSTLASKLLQHFWGLTGSERGWLDGLEHPKYDELFTGTYGVHAIASGILSEWEAKGNALQLVSLLREINSIQVFLNKLSQPVPTTGTYIFPATTGPASPVLQATRIIQYEKVDELWLYFRTTTAWDNFIAKAPKESVARIVEHDAVVDLLIERVLIPVDSVRSYGDEKVVKNYKIQLVKEVARVFERLGDIMTIVAEEEREGWSDT